MKLIVGLGNPGKQYERTRHNAGFMVLDEIINKFCFQEFGFDKKVNADITIGNIYSQKVIAIKPMTYMNKSGEAVQKLVSFYKLTPKDVLVLHDEIDLVPGKVKFKQGGGAAGHNGLKDIIARIGPDFFRLRLGVGRPATKEQVTDYVLSKMPKTQILDMITHSEIIPSIEEFILQDEKE